MIRFAVLLVCLSALTAQEWNAGFSAAATDLALRRLGNDVRVLYVTAHPDDEDAALLTALARGRAWRVALLTLSRGEGGANLAGPEMGDALGALRTEELLAAGRFYGLTAQFFTRAVDFGFSKRLDETWEHWPHDAVLHDAVRVVRLFRPSVIIARFHGTSRDGHGNHQAAGVIAREAWEAAADPARFPDAGPAWKALKLYRSVRGSESRTVGVQTDVADPLLGGSLRDIAVAGYRQHRTQAMAGSDFQFRGGPVAGLELIGSRLQTLRREDDIADGLDTAVRPAIEYDPRRPWTAAAEVARIRPVTPEVEDALRRVLGIRLDAVAEGDRAAVTPGESVVVRVSVRQHPEGGARLLGVRLLVPGGWTVREEAEGRFRVQVPGDARPTRPQWRQSTGAMYDIDRPEIAHLPFPPPELVAELRYSFAGQEYTEREPVQVQTTDPLYGPQRRNLTVVPAVNLSVSPRVAVVPADRRTFRVQVRATGPSAGSGRVRLRVPAGWKAEPAEAPFGDCEFRVTVGPGATTGAIEAEAERGGQRWTEGYEMAGYRGLEPHALYRPARVEVRVADIAIAPGLRVGYVAGAGDAIPEALGQLGIPVQALSDADVAGDLSRFDAIVIGVRASAVRSGFRTHRERLLDYVKAGGNLIVQYQTFEFDEAPWGPWPYQVRRDAEEVSEENAAVRLLAPEHPLLRTPNRITAADFAGWVEERGSKFMTVWDPRYTALLESHDREQPPQRGGLLTTEFGRGRWTYAAYAFYRQLPAGVPGAWRLFANLLSAGRDQGTRPR